MPLPGQLRDRIDKLLSRHPPHDRALKYILAANCLAHAGGSSDMPDVSISVMVCLRSYP